MLSSEIRCAVDEEISKLLEDLQLGETATTSWGEEITLLEDGETRHMIPLHDMTQTALVRNLIVAERLLPKQLMTFSEALTLVQAGQRVARREWNGKDMFIFLVPGSTFQVSRPPLLGIYPEGTTIDYHAHIDMRTADGQIVPWLASQTDLLAHDWELVHGDA